MSLYIDENTRSLNQEHYNSLVTGLCNAVEDWEDGKKILYKYNSDTHTVNVTRSDGKTFRFLQPATSTATSTTTSTSSQPQILSQQYPATLPVNTTIPSQITIIRQPSPIYSPIQPQIVGFVGGYGFRPYISSGSQYVVNPPINGSPLEINVLGGNYVRTTTLYPVGFGIQNTYRY